MNNQPSYKIPIIMLATSFVLLAFCFFIFQRRNHTPIPQGQQAAEVAETPVKAQYEWADFDSKAEGAAFKYPKNVFTNPDTKATTAGSLTRFFLGTSVNGTLSASSISRQFEPGNIVDPSAGKITTASAINVGGKIGYQYETKYGTCSTKVVQVANGSQTVMFSFASCASDEEPKVASNQELILGVLGGVKLTPQAPEPEPEPENSGEGIDTLPPGTIIQ